jgi:hypothetical protein
MDVVGVEEELKADVCIEEVKFFTAVSICSGVLRLMLRLILLSRFFLNCSQFILPFKKERYLNRLRAQAFNDKRTGEWSEQGSERLLISVLIWLGMLEIKMSNMSGRFLTDVGQYVGPGGAIM